VLLRLNTNRRGLTGVNDDVDPRIDRIPCQDMAKPALRSVGGFSKTCAWDRKGLLGRFSGASSFLQRWFLLRVAFLQTVPCRFLTVLIIFTLNIMLAEFGARRTSPALRAGLEPSPSGSLVNRGGGYLCGEVVGDAS